MVADRHLRTADAGRVVSNKSHRLGRYQQARARPRRGIHDGDLVSLHQHRQLACRKRRGIVGEHVDAHVIRGRGFVQHRGCGGAGGVDQAGGEAVKLMSGVKQGLLLAAPFSLIKYS